MLLCLFGVAALIAAGPSSSAPAAAPPEWAYPPCIRKPAGEALDNIAPLNVPGSSIHFTAADIARNSVAPDWFPREHSALPAMLAMSHSEKIACAYCHLPDGSGRPENAKLAGLPVGYIFTQVKALHAGQRQAGKAGWPPTVLMQDAIADLTDAQIVAAAEYFSRQKNASFVRVLQREYAPAHKAGCGIFLSAPGPLVALRQSIVEMPIDAQRFERRDPHTTYIAYVPKGSIERGRKLAGSGGDGRTQPCAACHGVDLKSGPDLEGPPLAGRFATYLFRQLYGFQSGTRAGDTTQPMQAVVAQLTQSDMIDLAAYAASLKP